MEEIEDLIGTLGQKPLQKLTDKQILDIEDDLDSNWLFEENKRLLECIKEGINAYFIVELLNIKHYAETLSSSVKETWKDSLVNFDD